MELPDRLREHRPAELPLLNQPVCLGEAAGVTGGAAIDGDGVDHAVAVEQVVSGGGLEERVGPVAEVDAVNAVGNGSGDRKVVLHRVLRDGSEIAGDLNSWVGGFGKWMLEFFGN